MVSLKYIFEALFRHARSATIFSAYTYHGLQVENIIINNIASDIAILKVTFNVPLILSAVDRST